MRKILLCFLVSFPCVIYAQTNVTLTTKGNGSGGEGLHNEMPLPQVTYDDNTVSVVDSLCRTAEIVIKNTEGEIVHQSVSSLSPSTSVVYYAPDGTGNLYTIDLYIEDEEYYGYFE
jgi:hypothetical protein